MFLYDWRVWVILLAFAIPWWVWVMVGGSVGYILYRFVKTRERFNPPVAKSRSGFQKGPWS